MQPFEGFIDRVPDDGLIVANAGDATVRRLCKKTRARVVYYGVEGQDWGMSFRFGTQTLVQIKAACKPLIFSWVVAQQVACCFHFLGDITSERGGRARLSCRTGRSTQPAYRGVTRLPGTKAQARACGNRQGVHIYDDFAHHPSAVKQTLQAIRLKHPQGRIHALFEPRSATASRNIHQQDYAHAFSVADVTLLAPVARKEIAESERLDVHAIAAALGKRGREAYAFDSIEMLFKHALHSLKEGDTAVVMSNGTFGGIVDQLLAAMALRGAVSA